MARRKTTAYMDEDLLKAAKIVAVRTGGKEYEVLEDALWQYLGLSVIEGLWRRVALREDQALRLAYRELHAARR